MMAHKVIEAIDMSLAVVGEEMKAYLTQLREDIIYSVKFDFQMYEFPETYKMHYAPLPFSRCYYQLNYDDRFPVVLVLEQEDADTIRADVVQENMDGWHPQMVSFWIKNLGAGVQISFDESVRRMGRHDIDECTHKTRVLADSVLGLNLIMACNNIVYEENAAPQRLNQKRARKNRPPLFSYKTLAMKLGEKTQARSSVEAKSNRAGPRLHLRRGHIRSLKSGETTWVQPCVVGDESRGFVVKKYHVQRQGA